MIPEDKIAQVKEANDIVDVISGYVSLKKSGMNFKALCPFHTEKTGSFMVSPAKQIWHCFGCLEGGNVFQFIQKAEKLEFAEAVKLLAERKGITIELKSGPGQDLSDRLFELHEFAAKYFMDNLRSDKGRTAHRYLLDRDITKESMERWGLGFAVDSWDDFLNHAKKNKFTEKLLEAAGLIVRNEERKSYYDRFRKRIIYPVRNRYGKTCAFGARVLDKSLPKYVNSPESQIYSKGRILYGWPLAKDAISKQNSVVIVEGYMDVIMPHQFGITNVVASMGTALTPEQAQLIKRQAENVFICYDLDQAGITASLRGIDILVQEGMNVRVVSMPEGIKDPDELLVKQGKEAFEERIKNAADIVDFWLGASGAEKINTLQGKIKLANQLKPVVNKVKNELQKRGYLEKIAERLGLEARVVEKEYSRDEKPQSAGRQSAQAKPAGRENTPGNAAFEAAEKELLSMMLGDREAAKRVCMELTSSDITNRHYAKIFEEIARPVRETGNAPEGDISGILDGECRNIYTSLVVEKIDYPEMERAEKDLIKAIKINRIKRRIKELEPEAKKLGGQDVDMKKVNEYYQLQKDLKGNKR